MCGPKEGQKHADGNEIPSPSHTGGAGLPVRRLAGMLVGWLGQTPDVLPGDAGKGQSLTCPSQTARLRAAEGRSWGERNAAGRDGHGGGGGKTAIWKRCGRHALRRRF